MLKEFAFSLSNRHYFQDASKICDWMNIDSDTFMWSIVQGHEGIIERSVYIKKDGSRMFPNIPEWAEIWLKNEDRKILKSYLSKDVAENGKPIPEDNKKLVRYILKQPKKDVTKITKL